MSLNPFILTNAPDAGLPLAHRPALPACANLLSARKSRPAGPSLVSPPVRLRHTRRQRRLNRVYLALTTAAAVLLLLSSI